MTTIIDQTGGFAANAPLLSQGAVAGHIREAIGRGRRRILVLGPARSRRLAAVRQALGAPGYRLVVVDLASVRSRKDLDRAVLRATRSRDFYAGMGKLEWLAQRRPMAVVFHNLDACSGRPCESAIVYRIWSQLSNHTRTPLAVFTVRDVEFADRCNKSFPSFAEHVRRVTFFPNHAAGAAIGPTLFRRAV